MLLLTGLCLEEGKKATLFQFSTCIVYTEGTSVYKSVPLCDITATINNSLTIFYLNEEFKFDRDSCAAPLFLFK